jgi:hypothetical protein
MSRSGIIPVSSSDPQPPTSNLQPLLAYFLLTIVMTWPTILHLTEGIPGDGFDGWQNYWNMWWVKKALLELGTTPFFTDYLYPPNGASLLFHTLNIFNSFWTLPIQLNFGLAIAYNSVVLVSFTLAGYGGYLLSLDTLARLGFPASELRAAAFVGGLVFTMSPFHMAHLLGHMQVFSMIWPPFYVLWLLRTLQPPLPNAETEESFGFKRVILSDEGAKNLLRRPQIRGKVTFHGDSSASPQNDISEKVPGFCPSDSLWSC